MVLALFVLFILLLRLLIFVFKRVDNQKWNSRAVNLHRKIFYNPFIQLLTIEATKLSLIPVVVLDTDEKFIGDEIAAYLLLSLQLLMPLLFFFILYRNRRSLDAEHNRVRFGALYDGKNVTKQRDHHVHWLPLTFFYRRILFAFTTVKMKEYVDLQMISTNIVTLLVAAYYI